MADDSVSRQQNPVPGATVLADADAPVDERALATALINTKSLPPNLRQVKDLADQARAYHALNPYPLHAFRNWKLESRGPLPVCMPIAKRVVKRGAKWLFGQPIQIFCPGNAKLEELLREAWDANGMDSRAVSMAERGGQETGVVLKFDYDDQRDPALSIQSLSPVYEARLYPHPHRRSRLLMARIQYPFQGIDGKTYWYREEWTDWEEVHYEPVKDESFGRSLKQFNPDSYDGWQILSRETNEFGIIPMFYIRNLETDDFWGAADLWNLEEGDGLFRVLDRINLARYIQDRNNQYPYEPWLLDAQLDQDDPAKENPAGAPVVIETSDEAMEQGKQGKVEFAPTAATQHQSVSDYIRELKHEFEAAASAVEVDQKEFTNKGNLTRSVLEQLYMPMIEITHEKRKSWGKNGFCQFFAVVAKGLQNLGVPLGVNPKDRKTFASEIHWPEFFPMSEDEKTAAVGRTQEEEIAGYLTHDRAIEAVAKIEGVQDVQQLKDELAKEPRPSPNDTNVDPNAGEGGKQPADAAVVNMEKEVAGLRRVGGKAAE